MNPKAVDCMMCRRARKIHRAIFQRSVFRLKRGEELLVPYPYLEEVEEADLLLFRA